MTKAELLSMIDALEREVSLLRQRVAYLEAQRNVLPPAEPTGNVFQHSPFGSCGRTESVSRLNIEAY